MVKPSIIVVWLVSGLCVSACGGAGGGGGGGGGGMMPTTLRTVTVTGVPATLVPPSTAQLTATATFSDNSTQNVTTAATWESSNTGIATIVGGLVTARAPGTVDISATHQTVRGVANLSVTAAMLRANPGGPYQAEHDQDITFSGMASTSSPYPIMAYIWNCGQSVALNCDRTASTPTVTFKYRKCGISGRPACRAGSSQLADYTVRLTIRDTQGNTNEATTTVTVRNSY